MSVVQPLVGQGPSSPASVPTQPHPARAGGVCSLHVSLSSPVCVLVVCVCVRSLHRTPVSVSVVSVARSVFVVYAHVRSSPRRRAVASLSRLWLYRSASAPPLSSFLPLPLSADCIRRQPNVRVTLPMGNFLSRWMMVFPPSTTHTHTHAYTHL